MHSGVQLTVDTARGKSHERRGAVASEPKKRTPRLGQVKNRSEVLTKRAALDRLRVSEQQQAETRKQHAVEPVPCGILVPDSALSYCWELLSAFVCYMRACLEY